VQTGGIATFQAWQYINDLNFIEKLEK